MRDRSSCALQLHAAGVAILLLLDGAWPAWPAAAQVRGGDSRFFSTTVGALTDYPLFFHSHGVRIRGPLSDSSGSLVVREGNSLVLLVGSEATGRTADASAEHEIVGTFFDVGRLTETDPRIARLDLAALAHARLGKSWPGANELLVVFADSILKADPFPAPSLRALALVPERYVGSRVSVSGRFRGRNLFGDQ